MFFPTQAPLLARKAKLEAAHALHEFLRDVDDEEAWIREKEPLASSTNRGRDLIGVQNLIKKHQALHTEVQGHEPRIKIVCKTGEQLVKEGQFLRQTSIPHSQRHGPPLLGHQHDYNF